MIIKGLKKAGIIDATSVDYLVCEDPFEFDCDDYSFIIAINVSIHAIKYLIPKYFIYNTSNKYLLVVMYSLFNYLIYDVL